MGVFRMVGATVGFFEGGEEDGRNVGMGVGMGLGMGLGLAVGLGVSCTHFAYYMPSWLATRGSVQSCMAYDICTKQHILTGVPV